MTGALFGFRMFVTLDEGPSPEVLDELADLLRDVADQVTAREPRHDGDGETWTWEIL